MLISTLFLIPIKLSCEIEKTLQPMPLSFLSFTCRMRTTPRQHTLGCWKDHWIKYGKALYKLQTSKQRFITVQTSKQV